MTKKKMVIKNRFAEALAIKNREDGEYYSRRDVENITGISRKTIDRYYHNAGTQYNTRVVAALCEFLGISVGDFFIEVEVASDSEDSDPEVKPLLLASA